MREEIVAGGESRMASRSTTTVHTDQVRVVEALNDETPAIISIRGRSHTQARLFVMKRAVGLRGPAEMSVLWATCGAQPLPAERRRHTR